MDIRGSGTCGIILAELNMGACWDEADIVKNFPGGIRKWSPKKPEMTL
jgi:hypothetical protein